MVTRDTSNTYIDLSELEGKTVHISDEKVKISGFATTVIDSKCCVLRQSDAELVPKPFPSYVQVSVPVKKISPQTDAAIPNSRDISWMKFYPEEKDSEKARAIE